MTSEPPRSPDIWVMLRPATAYRALTLVPQHSSKWEAVSRPLGLLLWLGCIISLIATQRLTLRVVLDGMVNLSIVPLAEIVALAVVWRRARSVSFSRAVDLFFMGHGPWIIGLLGYATVWALVSPVDAFAWTAPRHIWPILLAVLVWSAYIDFCFFRDGLNRNCGAAWLDLVLERVIAWGLVIIVFGGAVLPSTLAGVIHS